MMPLKSKQPKKTLVTGDQEANNETGNMAVHFVDYRAWRSHPWPLLWSVQSDAECGPQEWLKVTGHIECGHWPQGFHIMVVLDLLEKNWKPDSLVSQSVKPEKNPTRIWKNEVYPEFAQAITGAANCWEFTWETLAFSIVRTFGTSPLLIDLVQKGKFGQ